MALAHFLSEVATLLGRAQDLEYARPDAKPEANTQDKLLGPLLDALGYGPDERTLEAGIRSLTLTKEWVDYFLLPEKRKAPWLMVEAKSFWDKNIWQTNKDQVLEYLRNYALDVGSDDPVPWLLLTNFDEWHLLRLSDREPFWSFTRQDLADPDFASEVYERLARENIPRNRLYAYYTERQRQELGEQFLRDLKLWRVILANGIRQSQPDLTLADIRQASHIILLRFLFIRLLENYGQEPYYVLGRLYKGWRDSFRSKPFIRQLQDKFEDTWESYNTELFAKNPLVDKLHIDTEYLEMLVLLNPTPDPRLIPITEGQILGFRSIYNYDFTTLSQDVLGTAYEQFLAHELVETDGVIKVLDNQETRKREGVFYTPDYIVRHIVRRVLEPQVKPHLDKALTKLEQGAYDDAFESVQRILAIRVVDPACGSGSFLLGAFDFLTEALEHYNKAAQAQYHQSFNANGSGGLFGDDAPASPPKTVDYLHERVLVQCLYGVDLDPQAVGLAKLSLWTQLLRAHPGQYGRKGAPHAQLPALTLNIRSGNSLIDAASPALTAEHESALTDAADLARKAKDVSENAPARAATLKELDTAIADINAALLPNLLPYFAANDTLRRAIQSTGQEDDNASLEAVRHYLLTGKKPRLIHDWENETLADILDALRQEAAALEEVRDKRPFNWHVEFPDVFDPAMPKEERGFTAVIGNPPYFNLDTLGRKALEYDWFRTQYAEIYNQNTDILFYFFGRGYEILRSGGELGFIVSRSFIQANKAKGLRGFLTEKTTLNYLLDFLGHKVFKAGIATAILQFAKEPPDEKHSFDAYAVLDLDEATRGLGDSRTPQDGIVKVTVKQSDLTPESWTISPYQHIFKKIDDAHPKLDELEWVEVGKGMETSANEVFFLPWKKIVELKAESYAKPRATNSLTKRFGIEAPQDWAIFLEDVEFESLPQSLQKHLEEHRKILESRNAYKRGSCAWFRYAWPRHKEIAFNPKIIIPYRGKRLHAFVDDDGQWLGSDDNRVVLFEDSSKAIPYVICSLLLSAPLEFRLRALGGLSKLTGPGVYEFFNNQLGRLPIPELSPDDEKQLDELGRRAHELFRQRYALIETYRRVLGGQMSQETAFWVYHDPAGDYGHLVTYSSPNPNRLGHLLGLRVEASDTGYRLWGEVSDEEDWREGEREWAVLAEVAVSHEALRRLLLFRAHYLTEFDEGFRRKQKFTQSATENVLEVALRSLSAPEFDSDAARNLRILETLEARVQAEVTSEPLEKVMLELGATEREIDAIAFRVYDVEAHRSDIEEALKVVL